MPKTTTKVSLNSNGQYQVTVPKQLADAMSLDGETVEWSVVASRKLAFEPVE